MSDIKFWVTTFKWLLCRNLWLVCQYHVTSPVPQRFCAGLTATYNYYNFNNIIFRIIIKLSNYRKFYRCSTHWIFHERTATSRMMMNETLFQAHDCATSLDRAMRLWFSYNMPRKRFLWPWHRDRPTDKANNRNTRRPASSSVGLYYRSQADYVIVCKVVIICVVGNSMKARTVCK